MALTEFQRDICRLIAAERLRSGESYIAGAVALNVFTGGSRISRDIDLFDDTIEAVDVSWHADRDLLEFDGYLVKVQNERPGFVEAEVTRDEEAVVMQWKHMNSSRLCRLRKSGNASWTPADNYSREKFVNCMTL